MFVCLFVCLCVQKISQDSQDHYRECVGRVICVNCNTAFTFMWKIIKTVLNQHTVEKVRISTSFQIQTSLIRDLAHWFTFNHHHLFLSTKFSFCTVWRLFFFVQQRVKNHSHAPLSFLFCCCLLLHWFSGVHRRDRFLERGPTAHSRAGSPELFGRVSVRYVRSALSCG
jgi:Na+/melibiose symporter-like transporter